MKIKGLLVLFTIALGLFLITGGNFLGGGQDSSKSSLEISNYEGSQNAAQDHITKEPVIDKIDVVSEYDEKKVTDELRTFTKVNSKKNMEVEQKTISSSPLDNKLLPNTPGEHENNINSENQLHIGEFIPVSMSDVASNTTEELQIGEFIPATSPEHLVAIENYKASVDAKYLDTDEGTEQKTELDLEEFSEGVDDSSTATQEIGVFIPVDKGDASEISTEVQEIGAFIPVDGNAALEQ